MSDEILIVILLLAMVPATLLLKKFLDNIDSSNNKNDLEKNEPK